MLFFSAPYLLNKTEKEQRYSRIKNNLIKFYDDLMMWEKGIPNNVSSNSKEYLQYVDDKINKVDEYSDWIKSNVGIGGMQIFNHISTRSGNVDELTENIGDALGEIKPIFDDNLFTIRENLKDFLDTGKWENYITW